MPTYFLARWHHEVKDEPVLLYEELDDDRYETRKVHQFGDGQLERTAQVAPELRTSLSPEPIPAAAGIDAQDEFTVLPLTAAEFEVVWDRANEVE